MSFKSPKEYLNFIINFLKDDSKLPKTKICEEVKELEIDIFSENMFEQLYNNLLYFYGLHQKKNIGNEVQKYFFSEIINILDIIHETNFDIFFRNNFVKATLIYIIYSLKTPMNVNPEIVLKIFLGFKDIFKKIESKKIDDELSYFEMEIIKIIHQLIIIYYKDSNNDLGVSEKNTFFEIIENLQNNLEYIPIYFHGFVDYNELSNGIKFLIIKIFRYFQKINPYTDNDKNSTLFQGYSLYGITSYEKIPKINLEKFRNIQTKRIKNNDAKSILTLSTKFLQEKDYQNFIKELQKEKFEFSDNTSKVIDIFDDTEKYYQNLYNQLKYYLSLYNNPINYEGCEIYNNNYSRVLWLNFNKLLLLNLSENDIFKENIKIIFYFIVNLFSPDIDSSSLEFRIDTIPKLFSQTITSTEILDYPEIYKIIDKEYSKYYPRSGEENNFTKTFIKMKNKKTLNMLKKAINQMPIGNKIEIENITKHNLILPFPLLQDYLLNLKEDINNYSFSQKNLYNFYKYCFLDFEKIEQDNFIGNINNTDSPIELIDDDDIKEIIDDINFIDLVKNIMKSPVMKDAYNRIFYYYSTNRKFDMFEEDLPDGKISEENNLINNKTILAYYNEFCAKLNDLNYNKLFIIMNLPESIKGFAFRFLKIIINSEGVKLKTNGRNIDKQSIFALLKAYLIFLVIHELNHFMKRYLNQNKSFKVYKTPEIKDYKEGGEGEQLIKLLFGHILIENSLNIKQAEYILDINNWKNQSVQVFRNDFMKIKKNNNNDKCIVFLSSEEKSICDHSKLFG